MTTEEFLLQSAKEELGQTLYSPSFFKGAPVEKLTHEELLKAYYLLTREVEERLEASKRYNLRSLKGYGGGELAPDGTNDVSGCVVLKANPSLWPFPEPPSVPDGDMYDGIVNAPPISKVEYEQN